MGRFSPDFSPRPLRPDYLGQALDSAMAAARTYTDRRRQKFLDQDVTRKRAAEDYASGVVQPGEEDAGGVATATATAAPPSASHNQALEQEPSAGAGTSPDQSTSDIDPFPRPGKAADAMAPTGGSGRFSQAAAPTANASPVVSAPPISLGMRPYTDTAGRHDPRLALARSMDPAIALKQAAFGEEERESDVREGGWTRDVAAAGVPQNRAPLIGRLAAKGGDASVLSRELHPEDYPTTQDKIAIANAAAGGRLNMQRQRDLDREAQGFRPADPDAATKSVLTTYGVRKDPMEPLDWPEWATPEWRAKAIYEVQHGRVAPPPPPMPPTPPAAPAAPVSDAKPGYWNRLLHGIVGEPPSVPAAAPAPGARFSTPGGAPARAGGPPARAGGPPVPAQPTAAPAAPGVGLSMRQHQVVTPRPATPTGKVLPHEAAALRAGQKVPVSQVDYDLMVKDIGKDSTAAHFVVAAGGR